MFFSDQVQVASNIRFQQILIRLSDENCLPGLTDAVLFHQDRSQTVEKS
jgi:hypothetical protein